MERLQCTPCWSLPDGPCLHPWDSLVGPFVFHSSELYVLSELYDGSFDVYREVSALSNTGVLRRREGTKLWYLFLRLIDEFKKPRVYEPPPGGGPTEEESTGSQPGSGDQQAQQQQQQQEPPPPASALKAVFVVPVTDDPEGLLRRNAGHPEVVDYTGVSAFAWYIAVEGSAKSLLASALARILRENQERLGIGAAPQGPPGGRGGAGRGGRGGPPVAAGRGPGRGRGRGGAQELLWRQSVEAVNGSAVDTALGDSCLFHHRRDSRPTEDWSFTFRDEEDLATMLTIVYTQGAVNFSATSPPLLGDIAGALAGTGGMRNQPEFYRLRPAAQLPLPGGASARFGRDAALAAFLVRPQALDVRSRTRSKATRFMLLRPQSRDLELQEMERASFSFLNRNPPLPPGNKEGAITRFRLHVERVLRHALWNGSLLGRHADRLFEVETDGAGKDVLVPCSPDSRFWSSPSPDVFSLRHPFDTADGPRSPQPGGAAAPHLRVVEAQALRAPDATGEGRITGVLFRVEGYGDEQAFTLEAEPDGRVLSDCLVLPGESSFAVGKRRRQADRLPVLCGAAGPCYPSPSDWRRDPGSNVWRPVRRLMWESGPSTLAIVRLERDEEGEWRVVCRATLGREWLSAPVDPGGCVEVPSFASCREALKRRLEVDYVEVLNCTDLLPSSFRRMLAWMEKYREDLRAGERTSAGWGFPHANLVPQAALFAQFLYASEYFFDLHSFHHQLWKNYMSAKHICQTFKKNVKMLHIINLGPPGTGKSYLLTVLEMITPDGVVEAVTHVSDQRNFADLLHIEENTSIVNTYDEARHDMLGTGRRGDHRGGGGNYVENATTSRANENKETLTKQRVSSVYLRVSKDGGRERKHVIAAVQVPQLVNMNNYYNMADAVRSRYSGVPCYPFLRLDKSDIRGRVMDEARTAAAENHSNFYAALYVVQAAYLDTMQGTGMCAPVAEEGWAAFSSRFEEVLTRQFPYALPEGFVLKRVMDDAFQYCRMITNFNAVYLTFGHPNAPHGNLANFSVEALRFAERCTVPSDEAMVLAISMVEEDIFPVAERDVLVEAAAIVARLAEKPVPNHPDAHTTREVSPKVFYHELLAANDEPAGVRPVPPEPFGPLRPWRTFAVQYHRLKGLLVGGDSNNYLQCGLPSFDRNRQDLEAVVAADEYVVLCEANCHEPGDMYRLAAADLHPRLSAKESKKKPEEHIETVLRCLNKRTVRDSNNVPVRVVRVERVEGAPITRHRLLVHKVALDEAANNRLSVEAVFRAMAHRYTRPGVYLLNRPFQATSDAYLPQLAAAFTVGLHAPECALTPAAAGRAVAEAARDAYPWACSAAGCTCFRKERVFVTQGVSIPRGVRTTLQRSMRAQDLTAVGMAETSRTELSCPFDELGWRAHVRRLMGKEVEQLTPQERELMAPAHPRSMAWTSADGGSAGSVYPFTEALHTLKEKVALARRRAQDGEEEDDGADPRQDRWKPAAEVEAARLGRLLERLQ